MKRILLLWSLFLGIVGYGQVWTVKSLKERAEKGYAKEQYQLGINYERGDGVTKSLPQAAYWFEKAALQGHIDAQYKLGHYYFYGRKEGITRSFPKSRKWMEKAAAQGHSKAQYFLGILRIMQSGKGHLDEGLDWLEKSCENGCETACKTIERYKETGRIFVTMNMNL